MEDDPIIDWRKPTNQTNIDLQEKLALKSKEIHELWELSFLVLSEEEFQSVLIALLLLIQSLEDEDCKNKSCTSTANDADSNGGQYINEFMSSDPSHRSSDDSSFSSLSSTTRSSYGIDNIPKLLSHKQ